jgi:hypothetical protein
LKRDRLWERRSSDVFGDLTEGLQQQGWLGLVLSIDLSCKGLSILSGLLIVPASAEVLAMVTSRILPFT